jgi:hypothetical protein
MPCHDQKQADKFEKAMIKPKLKIELEHHPLKIYARWLMHNKLRYYS